MPQRHRDHSDATLSSTHDVSAGRALTTRLDSADVRTDVVESSNDIRENIIERNQAIARERLREEFGTDAERFINNQSAIDFEALREFLEQQRVNVERLQNLELGPALLIDIET